MLPLRGDRYILDFHENKETSAQTEKSVIK